MKNPQQVNQNSFIHYGNTSKPHITGEGIELVKKSNNDLPVLQTDGVFKSDSLGVSVSMISLNRRIIGQTYGQS